MAKRPASRHSRNGKRPPGPGLDAALEHHREGRLERAAEMYRQILSRDPEHTDALHLLGAVALQRGEHARARDLIGRAVQRNPNVAAFHFNLAMACKECEDVQAAETHCREAVRLAPDHTDAHIHLAELAQRRGDIDTAIACYRAILGHCPERVDVWNDLGNLLQRQGCSEDAVDCYMQAIHRDPEFAEAYNNLGNIVQDMGRCDEAVLYFQEALRLKPDFALAHNNLGNARLAQQRYAEAIEEYRAAIRCDPDYAVAHRNLGVLLQKEGDLSGALEHYHEALQRGAQDAETLNNLANAHHGQGDTDAAIARFEQALQLNPGHAAAHNNLGNVLREQGREEEALEHFRRALESNPHFAEAHNNVGNIFKNRGALDKAIEHYRHALCLKPDYAVAYSNLGNTFKDRGDYAGALEAFQQALLIEPGLAEARLNRGIVLLTLGRFALGWQDYEYRKEMQEAQERRTFERPEWDGKPLSGERILVHAEQGLGDTLQFLRYLPLVKQRGGVVLFECQEALCSLLQGCAGTDELLARDGNKVPDIEFDLHVSLLSLPVIFNTSLQDIPAEIPYLEPPAEKVAAWRSRLTQAGLKVGLVWMGNPRHSNDANRSCGLGAFAPLAQMAGVTFYSLQKGPGSEQAEQPPGGLTLVDWTSELDDFSDTAALVANLDLVITVDTSVAHLAGALGRPVWTLLPHVPDWRWMLHREDSPWYPTMRLFRQPRRGDWETVMASVRTALAARGEKGGQTPFSESGKRGLSPFFRSGVGRPNILFSTTCMWNPGDEFILFGVRNLLRPLTGPFNALVYNRNPDLHALRIGFDGPVELQTQDAAVQVNFYEALRPHLIPRDNSWHERTNIEAIDLAVFAGTPEWSGVMVQPLVEALLHSDTPAVYLGVGAFEGTASLSFEQLPVKDQLMLIKAHLITARDTVCADGILDALNVHHLPCPALFAADRCTPREGPGRLALSTQGISTRNGQRVHPQTLHYTVELYRKLAQRFECALVCHYIDELTELRPLLGDCMELLYSHEARDYAEIYDAFDLAVTTRVHGAGMCASLGIPAFLISHSTRSSTAAGFRAQRIDPQSEPVGEAVERIARFDVAAESAALCAHKERVREQYNELLRPALSAVGLAITEPGGVRRPKAAL